MAENQTRRYVQTFHDLLDRVSQKEIDEADLYVWQQAKRLEHYRKKVSVRHLVELTGYLRYRVHDVLNKLIKAGLVKRSGFGKYQSCETASVDSQNCSENHYTLKGDGSRNCSENHYTTVAKNTTLVYGKSLHSVQCEPDQEPINGASKRKKIKGLAPDVASVEPTGSTTTGAKAIRKKKTKPAPDPKVTELFTTWRNLHHKHFGTVYAFAWEKDGAMFKRLLKTHPLDDLTLYMESFFDDDDPFLTDKAGYTVGVFSGQINKYAQRSSHAERSAPAWIPPAYRPVQEM